MRADIIDIAERSLTLSEREALEHNEAIIQRALDNFVEVGMALLDIRDRRLYRMEYRTFEDYCHQKWGRGARYARQIIAAAEVAGNLLDNKSGAIAPILLSSESVARPLTTLPPNQQREAWQRAVETAPNGKVTATHVAQVVEEIKTGRLANHQLINQSVNNEWYTPPQYIAAVHEVMGGIDIDPASSAASNRTVKARRFYTIKDDGFKRKWTGHVFLNPPYGIEDGEGSNQARWSARLIEQYRAGITTEAILLVNAVPSNKWFAPLWEFPICFTDHRIRFYNEDGEIGQPTHSNCFVYMGPKIDLFAKVFRKFGVIAVAYVLENER